MIINISEIAENGLNLNLRREPEWFNSLDTVDGKNGLVSISSDIEFSIQVIKVVKEINVRGTVGFELVTFCSLCLDEVRYNKQLNVNLTLSPSEDVEDEESDVDHETYTGEQIDLNSYFKEQISLSLPFKVKCDQNCKGLCASCGQNLNNGDCNCNTNWEDPRFSVLKGLKV